jgi:hypothetical protein
MKRKIQVRRGLAADRPTFSSGEIGLDTDTGSEKVWIGTPAGNKQLARSSDVPSYVLISIPCLFSSNFGSQATNYGSFGGSLSTTEASVAYMPFGVTGEVVGMYYQSKTNTHNASFTLTLQSGAADASSLTASDFVVAVGTSVLNVSKTDATLAVTPTMIGGFKFVSASGSGTSTLIGITLVVKCTLA